MNVSVWFDGGDTKLILLHGQFLSINVSKRPRFLFIFFPYLDSKGTLNEYRTGSKYRIFLYQSQRVFIRNFGVIAVCTEFQGIQLAYYYYLVVGSLTTFIYHQSTHLREASTFSIFTDISLTNHAHFRNRFCKSFSSKKYCTLIDVIMS